MRTEPVSVMWVSEFSLQRIKIFLDFIARSMTFVFISGRRTVLCRPQTTPGGPLSLLLSWRQGFFLGCIAADLNLVLRFIIVLHVFRARGSIRHGDNFTILVELTEAFTEC